MKEDFKIQSAGEPMHVQQASTPTAESTSHPLDATNEFPRTSSTASALNTATIPSQKVSQPQSKIPKKESSSTTTAIVATVIIVLALAAMSVVAYLQSK